MIYSLATLLNSTTHLEFRLVFAFRPYETLLTVGLQELHKLQENGRDNKFRCKVYTSIMHLVHASSQIKLTTVVTISN